MEYALLIKVATTINYIVNSGYLIAGGCMLKTIIRYVNPHFFEPREAVVAL